MRRALNEYFSLNTIYPDLIVLALVTVFLGLYGGVPYYHPDVHFVIEAAMNALSSGGSPGFFSYPGLVIYANSLAYGLTLALMALFGRGMSMEEFALQYDRLTLASSPVEISAYFPGHLVTVLFAVVGVLSCYLIVFNLTRQRVMSGLAGLILSTSLLWVADSHYLTVDVPMASMAALAALVAVAFTRQGEALSVKRLAILGVAAALTAAAKYNGGVVVAPVVGATFFYYRDRRRWLRDLLIIGLVALVVYLAINPFMIFDYEKFRHDILWTVGHTQEGHDGYYTERAWLFHLRTTLVSAVGAPVLLLAALGGAWFWATRRYNLATKVALTAFPAAYYAMVAGTVLAFQRYMVPMLPFVAAFAGLGLYAICLSLRRWIDRPALSKALVVLLGLGVMAPNLLNSVRHDYLLSRQDTRSDLEVIVRATNLDGVERAILSGSYTGLIIPKSQIRREFKKVDFEAAEIAVFDSFSHDRLIYDTRFRKRLYTEGFGFQYALQISPFTVPKEGVPFSPKSLYSPFVPDLRFRAQAGPFVEIYLDDADTAQEIMDACEELAARCTLLPAAEGYYYQKLKRG